MRKINVLKKISLILAVTTLLVGLFSLPGSVTVRSIYADSSGETGSTDTQPAENNTANAETTPTADPSGDEKGAQDPPADENSGDGSEQDPPADDGSGGPDTQNNDPTPEPPSLSFASFSVSSMSVSGPTGDDPNVQIELPDFGTNYNNGDCVTNDACTTAEPVTNPNDYSDQGSYGEKDYDLPEIDGHESNIVAIKEGNQWYFFKKGSGETCVSSTFCVNYDDNGHVSVYSYQTQGKGYKGYNMIHFWYVGDDDNNSVEGCTDATALNYNPNATTDDGSCQYDQTILGCVDPTALNYDPTATSDDGSCQYDQTILGCIDPTALNYDPNATTDDGSCQYDDPGDPGTPGTPGNPGTPGTPTTLIPVTAQTGAGGPTEELLLIPVTGVDHTFPLTTWQRLFFSASALLFGITLILEGITRKRKI